MARAHRIKRAKGHANSALHNLFLSTLLVICTSVHRLPIYETRLSKNGNKKRNKMCMVGEITVFPKHPLYAKLDIVFTKNRD